MPGMPLCKFTAAICKMLPCWLTMCVPKLLISWTRSTLKPIFSLLDAPVPSEVRELIVAGVDYTSFLKEELKKDAGRALLLALTVVSRGVFPDGNEPIRATTTSRSSSPSAIANSVLVRKTTVIRN